MTVRYSRTCDWCGEEGELCWCGAVTEDFKRGLTEHEWETVSEPSAEIIFGKE